MAGSSGRTCERSRLIDRIHIDAPVVFVRHNGDLCALCSCGHHETGHAHGSKLSQGELGSIRAPTPARRGPWPGQRRARSQLWVSAPFSRPAGTGDLQPGRPAGDYRGISVVFAGFRAASASALLTAVLALGAAPSLSAQGQAPSAWVFDYVKFVTRADGWVMATNETGQNSFTKR